MPENIDKPKEYPYSVVRCYFCPASTCTGHMLEHRFETAQAARDFRVRAIQTQGTWAPRGSRDIEVSDIAGPEIVHERPTAEGFARGGAMVREALANARGPMARDLARDRRVKTEAPDWKAETGYDEPIVEEVF